MRKVLFKSENKKTSTTYSEVGIWSYEQNFIPINSLKLNIYKKEGKNYLWTLFSPNYSYGYFTWYEDDFIKLIASTIAHKAEYEITNVLSIDRGEVIDLQDGLKFEYSYRNSLLFVFKNSNNKITNKLWLEDWAVGQMFTFEKEFDGGFSEKEQKFLTNPENDFSYGEFYKGEEEKAMNPWGCIFLIIAIILGWILGSSDMS